MKIVGISDLHGDLISKKKIGKCDIVCICGDIVPLNIQRDIFLSAHWLIDEFIPWTNRLDCERVLLVAGNHDFFFDTEKWLTSAPPQMVQLYHEVNETFENSKVVYLEDDLYIHNGLRFYGCPKCTGPAGWAFYQDDEEEPFKYIPLDVDVVLTHQPPFGQVGTVLELGAYNYQENYGSYTLYEKLTNPECRIKYLLCGHIHSGQHTVEMIGKTKCYNVSLKNERYKVAFQPLELSI